MPFGGVGTSGMGRYYGKHGFNSLSNSRSILYCDADVNIDVIHPPYNDAKLNAVKAMFAPIQVIPSFGVLPEFSIALNTPVGNGFTVIVTVLKVVTQVLLLVTSTVTLSPLISPVVLKVLLGPLYKVVVPFNLNR